MSESLPVFNCGRWQGNFRLSKYYVINMSYFHISIFYCRIGIKLGKSRMTIKFISYKSLFYVTSVLADMTSLSFQLRISLLLYVWLSHNLVREMKLVHVTLRSYKISYDLEGHLDLWDQLQDKQKFFLYRLICPYITPSILDWITPKFYIKKGTSGYIGITSPTSLDWHISVIYCRIQHKPTLAKSDWWSASVF